MLTLDLRAGPVLNVEDTQSRILEFRVYQLKSYVNVNNLDWDKFRLQGGDRDQLQSVLTDPQHPDTVISGSVEMNESRQTAPTPRLDGTRYLLLVALGRQRGASSIRLVPLRYFQRHVRLCFTEYNVFEGPFCDRFLSGDRH